ncbi:MAG: hypothetical protein MUP17_03300 [candidate division Zixibacteria bacterium]|nr:hypothetical protein [candidate division Zixibacteria bacterium]
MLKRFNKIFGIQESAEEEKRKFTQRINQTVFDEIEEDEKYGIVFRTICYGLGKNADDLIDSANPILSSDGYNIPALRKLTGDNFLQTLRILELLYRFFKKNNDRRKTITSWIENALSIATVDLGVRWKKGMFYPSGAKVLDKKLVEEPLDWLEDYPNEKSNFLKAIKNYTSKKYDQVIIDCYLVVEGLVRKILKNKKTLDNNCDELFKKIGLSQEWKSFLKNYIVFANQYKRHASDKQHAISPSEVESFLYFTGLMTRLIIESK